MRSRVTRRGGRGLGEMVGRRRPVKQAALCGAGSDAVALRIDSSRPHVGLEVSRAVQAG